MRHHRLHSAALLLIISLFALAACRQPESHNASSGRVAGARGGRLVFADRNPPQTLNYLMAKDTGSFAVCSMLTGRLVDLDHDTQNFTPALAESWEPSDGGRVVTVKLREGLKFSDGAPLTADDVIFTLQAAYDEKLNSIFRDALTVDGQPMKATKVDGRTVRLELPRAVAAIEPNLSNIGVLPRHKLEAAYARGEFGGAWATTSAPADFATSGPFTLKEFVPGQRTVLARNEHYWKKDAAGVALPYLDELVIEAVPDANTQMLKFQQGEVDVLDNLRPADYALLLQQPGNLNVKDFGPGVRTEFLYFNLNDGKDASGKPFVEPAKRAWFADARFRRAVAHALDRAAMVQNVFRGLATPLDGIVPPSNKRWVSAGLPRYDFNQNRAKELLQEAGFKLDAGNTLTDAAGHAVEFTLLVPENQAERRQMAAIIQEDLAKLGIKVSVVPVEAAAFSDFVMKKFNYEAAMQGASATDTDPSSYSPLLKSDGTQHYWFLGQKQPQAEWEKQLDRALDEQDVTADAAARKAKFDEAQRVFAEQLPMIPLVVRHHVSGAKSSLGNYRSSPLPPRSLWNADELFWKK
jgi:peptide/nickel transport system substrate-binding protein